MVVPMYRKYMNLTYLNNKPKRLNWKVIAGDEDSLDYYQTYDLIFDDYDLKIRKIDGLAKV